MLVFNTVGNLFVETSLNIPLICPYTFSHLACYHAIGRHFGLMEDTSPRFWKIQTLFYFKLLLAILVLHSQTPPQASGNRSLLLPHAYLWFRYLKFYDYAFYHLCHILDSRVGGSSFVILQFCFCLLPCPPQRGRVLYCIAFFFFFFFFSFFFFFFFFLSTCQYLIHATFDFDQTWPK